MFSSNFMSKLSKKNFKIVFLNIKASVTNKIDFIIFQIYFNLRLSKRKNIFVSKSKQKVIIGQDTQIISIKSNPPSDDSALNSSPRLVTKQKGEREALVAQLNNFQMGWNKWRAMWMERNWDNQNWCFFVPPVDGWVSLVGRRRWWAKFNLLSDLKRGRLVWF